MKYLKFLEFKISPSKHTLNVYFPSEQPIIGLHSKWTYCKMFDYIKKNVVPNCKEFSIEKKK